MNLNVRESLLAWRLPRVRECRMSPHMVSPCFQRKLYQVFLTSPCSSLPTKGAGWHVGQWLERLERGAWSGVAFVEQHSHKPDACGCSVWRFREQHIAPILITTWMYMVATRGSWCNLVIFDIFRPSYTSYTLCSWCRRNLNKALLQRCHGLFQGFIQCHGIFHDGMSPISCVCGHLSTLISIKSQKISTIFKKHIQKWQTLHLMMIFFCDFCLYLPAGLPHAAWLLLGGPPLSMLSIWSLIIAENGA